MGLRKKGSGKLVLTVMAAFVLALGTIGSISRWTVYGQGNVPAAPGSPGSGSRPQGAGNAGSGAAGAGDMGGANAGPGVKAADSAATTLRVFSRETVVDVTVTDSKGEPIHGLQSSDFTISEDGKPQSIRSFKEYGADTPLVPPQPARTPPPNVYVNVPTPPTTSAVNILLLDALNTQAADQVFMKQESIRYLKNMPKGTRVAVFGLSSRLRILQGFTADPAVLLAVVDSKKNRSLPSPFTDSDTGEAIDALADVVDDGTAATFQEFQNEVTTAQADMRNRMTLEALNQIAAYVSGIKGRKNLIWFTAGMPLNIFPSGGVQDLQGITDYSKDLRKTTDLLTAAEVAVYPVDARGLFNDPALSAARPATGLSRQNALKKAAASAAANNAFLKKTGDELLSMEAIAEATGGVAYYNTNDLKTAVGKAIQNGANYYTVSYVPAGFVYDGRYHAIDVKVSRAGVHLGYRKGYNADDVANNAIAPGLTLATTAPEPYGDNMEASMQRGVPTSSQLLFSVRVEPTATAPKETDPAVMGVLDPKLQGKALTRYDFKYVFPAKQLTFAETADGMHTGSVVFAVYAFDVYGKLITSLKKTLTLPLKPSQYQSLQSGSSPFQNFMQLDLPPGEVFLRVGVLDVVSDKIGTMEIPLAVKKIPPPPPAAAAPGEKSVK